MAKAKKIVGIDCAGRAADAVALVLRPRLEEMCRLRERALDFSDPEGVHDMRVASRRLRSAIRDFVPYLRKRKLSAPARQLKEIADKLGEVRDYDVAIIALEKLQKKVSGEVSSGLQRIIGDQKAEREIARTELTSTMSSSAISELEPAFLEAIGASVTPAAEETTKTRTTRKTGSGYKVFARVTLLRRLKELVRLSTSLYQPHEVKPLHEMRMAAKRLRYAQDLFGHCWGESLEVFSRQVAKLQTSLGELHDCDIWIEHFGKRLHRVKTKPGEQATPQDERAAMIWLLSHFTRLRTKHFRAALARWHEWESKDFCNRLAATLRT
jgi:CHAD domain-containing protein